MKKNGTPGANYRLVARMSGSKLTVAPELREELREEHLRAIRALETGNRDLDRLAQARSIEWERLGDFLAGAGRVPDAVRAYREAVLCCLDGEYYDCGRAHFPARWLRMRFFAVYDRALSLCGDDPRLKELFEDRLIREEYDRFRA